MSGESSITSTVVCDMAGLLTQERCLKPSEECGRGQRGTCRVLPCMAPVQSCGLDAALLQYIVFSKQKIGLSELITNRYTGEQSLSAAIPVATTYCSGFGQYY